MRVALVYPNQSRLEELSGWKYPNVFYRPHPIIHLGMSYLRAAIESEHEVFYLDNNLSKMPDEQLAAWCLLWHLDVVGFGGTLTEWPQAAAVARRLKGKVLTIYGGPNATARPEKHVKHFDYVLRGYGEDPFLRWNREDRETIPGLCWDGHIVEPCLKGEFPGRPIRQHLAEYHRADAKVCPPPVDVVMSSRGCPYGCRFCSSTTIWGRTYYAHEPDDVADEIRYMVKTHGTRTVHFREDNFTANRDRLERMCAVLHSLDVKWICQSRLKALERETIRLMKQSGCVLVCCGFESANDSTLEYIRKGHTFADIQNVVQLLEEEGLHYSGGFMVGVLNEGEEEIRTTLEYTRWLSQQPHSFVPRGAGRFVGFPVSPMYYEMQREGLVEFDWQEGELLIPRTYKLTARQVEECMERWT